ncbi:hypothetical protein SEVIR_3G371350v4 [Setaria viridis]
MTAGSASMAAAQSPEPRDNLSLADVLSISVFMAVFFPLFVVLLAFACLHLLRRQPPRTARGEADVALCAGRRVEGRRRRQVRQGRCHGASSFRRRENSSRGAVAEEKRSV